MYKPDTDGVDHINIYSKGRTRVGVWMSNWTYEPIETEDGTFFSIEGYWFWLGSKDERLRIATGWKAKQLGKKTKNREFMSEEEFRGKIERAIRVKAGVAPDMMKELKATGELPLTHYYAWGNPPVVRDAGFKWIVKIWEQIRKEQ